MKKFSSLIIFAALTLFCNAQELSRTYGWKDGVTLEEVLAGIPDRNAPMVNLLVERVNEFAYDQEGNLAEYVFVHEQLYLNSPQAIDEHNKVYIPLNTENKLVKYDARVISPGGVRVLTIDDLKEGTDENDRKVVYFALSGVEKGSVVEYYFMLQKEPDITGNILRFQGPTPVVHSVFEIISPKNLVFSSLSLNGYPQLKKDTLANGQNRLMAVAENIPALNDEKFANVKGSAMMVVYQLAENKATGKRNLYNYGDASQYVYQSFLQEENKASAKKLEQMLKNSGYRYGRDQRDMIFKIENYVKLNIQHVESSDPRLSDVNFILENNVANDLGMNRLFFKLFRKAGIEFEMVLSSDRNRFRFDRDYECYAFLDQYLIYFPAIDDYLYAADIAMRVGLVPSGFLSNHGLFIRRIQLGDVETGAGEVKFIKPFPSAHTRHLTAVDVNFDEALTEVVAKVNNEWTGYYAYNFQPVYTYIEKDKVDEFTKDVVSSMYPDVDVENIQVSNKGAENLMIAPFSLACDIKTAKYLEKAGSNLLFKVGELIGPQMEMYQEGERRLGVENDFNRYYEREIRFTIPPGYACKNLDKLNMKITPFPGDTKSAGFESVYTQQGNQVTVKIYEYYNEIMLPREKFEDFRRVINAAADFNKVVLLFEKI